MISYNNTSITVRHDLQQAHERAWQRIANAGTWLDAEKRLEIARETRQARSCRFCASRKKALSPYAQTGSHEQISNLAPIEVDVVHRVVTDSGRITSSWVSSLLAEGIEDACYVEMVSVVTQVLVVDDFCLALGTSLQPLPEPEPGIPTRARPVSAIREGAFVPWIPHSEVGEDSKLFGTGLVPNMHRAMSLVPDAVRAAQDLMAAHYMPYALVPIYGDADHNRALSKSQMELLAARVSFLNDCFY
ncbi:MAG: hypothetical protein ACI9ON_000514 [Limisphaerales bacterium]|jgi:hypothetical protein